MYRTYSTVSNKQKNLISGFLKATDGKSRIRIQVMSRIRYPECGSKDPDPDSYQNVTDPEHYFKVD
jgi:hypothetical protein